MDTTTFRSRARQRRLSDVRKIKAPTKKQYHDYEIALALSWAPQMYPCAKCGWPVPDGYCCSTCRTGTPRQAAEAIGRA